MNLKMGLAVFLLALTMDLGAVANPSFVSIPHGLPGYNAVPSTIHSVAIHRGIIYFGTDFGLSISKDGGRTFQTATFADGLVRHTIYNIWVLGDSIYVNSNYGVYFYSDEDMSFRQLKKEELPAIAKESSSRWRVRGDVILIQDREGEVGVPIAKLRNKNIKKAAREGQIICIVSNDSFEISIDGGINFENHKIPANPIFDHNLKDITQVEDTVAVLSSSGLTFFQKGQEHAPRYVKIKKKAEEGPNWGEKNVRMLEGIYYNSNKRLLVSTYKNGIFSSFNLGQTFLKEGKEEHPYPHFGNIRGDGNLVVLVQQSIIPNRIYISRNSGETFSILDKESYPRENTGDVFVRGDQIFLGGPRGLYFSSNGGKSFRLLDKRNGIGCGEIFDTIDVHAVYADEKYIYVGTDTGLYVSADGGENFEETEINRTVSAISSDGKMLYVAVSGMDDVPSAIFALKNMKIQRGYEIPTHDIRKILPQGNRIFLMTNHEVLMGERVF